MKHTTLTKTTSQTKIHRAGLKTSAGPKGVAIAPPAYGIDVVDSQPIQAMSEPAQEPQQPENKTGLPDNLKAGLENLSGLSMADVKVHYNSSKPAQLQALAYTQGPNIYLGPGQEKHLPHEGWHVVQQMAGRVKPTMQMKGVNINDDAGLEKEAEVMGAKSREVRRLAKGTVGKNRDDKGNDAPKQRQKRVLETRMTRKETRNSPKPLPWRKRFGKAVQRFSVAGKAPTEMTLVQEGDMEGGHTWERHIGKSDRFLKDRAKEVTPEHMASTYSSEDVAERETKKCVTNNWTDIQNDWRGVELAGRRGNVWYTTPISAQGKKQLDFYKIFDHKGKRRWAKTIRVGLARIRRNGNPVQDEAYVNTSHPTV